MLDVTPESVDKYRKLSKKLTNSYLLLKLRKLFERECTLTESLERLHAKESNEAKTHKQTTQARAFNICQVSQKRIEDQTPALYGCLQSLL